MRKNDKHSNDELMEGFRAGQQKCFTEVFNLLYAPLCFYALKILDGQAVAEDIVEESLIKIWERREMFFEMNVLRSYLYTTVRNGSYDWIRNNKKLVSLEENDEHLEIEDKNNFFKQLITAEVYGNLSAALKQLSPQGRKIIEMIFFEGKNMRVTAEALGLSESTVKKHKYRSLTKLKNLLSGSMRLE